MFIQKCLTSKFCKKSMNIIIQKLINLISSFVFKLNSKIFFSIFLTNKNFQSKSLLYIQLLTKHIFASIKKTSVCLSFEIITNMLLPDIFGYKTVTYQTPTCVVSTSAINLS